MRDQTWVKITVQRCETFSRRTIRLSPNTYDFLIATEPMQILAIVLGSKLANRGGIVLAFFVYVHFVPILNLGQRYVF